MKTVAVKKEPLLWKRIVAKYKRGIKGGKAGQWSARKAQLATLDYQSRFPNKQAAYIGKRSRSNSLKVWTKQAWGTRSGRNSIQGPKASGERYLDRRSLANLTAKEYKETTAAKRRQIRKRKQFSKQPKKIASKTRKK